MARRLQMGALAVALVACSGEPHPDSEAVDTASVDGAGDASEGDGFVQSALELSAPEMTPCPRGWREVEVEVGEDLLAVCDPWPEGGPRNCAVGRAHFPGEMGCERIGSACLEGIFSPQVRDDRPVVHVQTGQPGGGDGTRVAPYGTIGEALAAAVPGTVIALGPGTYDELVELPSGVTLWGACVDATIVTSSIPLEDPTGAEGRGIITIRGDGAEVRNLRVSGPGAGIAVHANAHIEDVVLDSCRFAGLIALGDGIVTAQNLVVRDLERGETALAGLGATGGGRLEASRVVVLRSQTFGVVAADGAQLILEDAAVLDTQPAATGQGGSLALWDAAGGDVRRSVLQGASYVEIGAIHTPLTLTDVVFGTAGAASRGLDIEGGEAVLERVWLQGHQGFAIRLLGEATFLDASDVFVRDIESFIDDGFQLDVAGYGGHGLWLSAGTRARLQRVWVTRARGVGVLAHGEDTQLDGFDVAVIETEPMACSEERCRGKDLGIGLSSIDEALVWLDRFKVETNAAIGVQIARDGGLDLHNGEVSFNPIGVNLQVDDYDFDRLTDNVAYRDNGQNLLSDELPVPDPSVYLGR